MKANKDYDGSIISPSELVDFTSRSYEAEKVHLHTMAYRPVAGNSYELHECLLNLASQNTDIAVSVDAGYGLRIHPGTDTPIYWSNPLGLVNRDSLEGYSPYKQLRNAGVQLNFMGNLGYRTLFPYANVDHRKVSLIQNGDVTSFLMGFNVDHGMDESRVIDMGFMFKNPEVFEWLQMVLESDHFSDPFRLTTPDFEFVTRELPAGGDQEISNVIGHAVSRANHSISFYGQFVPDGFLLENIAKAIKRGVKVTIVTNSPCNNRQVHYSLIRSFQLKSLSKLSREYPGSLTVKVPHDPNIFIHLKALLIDSNSPFTPCAVMGTDNLTHRLLQKLGTREINFYNTNPDYVTYVNQYLKNRINGICDTYEL